MTHSWPVVTHSWSWLFVIVAIRGRDPFVAVMAGRGYSWSWLVVVVVVAGRGRGRGWSWSWLVVAQSVVSVCEQAPAVKPNSSIERASHQSLKRLCPKNAIAKKATQLAQRRLTIIQ